MLKRASISASYSPGQVPCAGSSRGLRSEFTRYIAAGALATVTDFSVLVLLIHGVNWHYLAANTLSFMGGSVASYLLSISWVFNARRSSSMLREFVLFTAVGAGGLLISQACMFSFVSLLHFNYIAAKLSSVGCTLIWNFCLKKILLFTCR